MSEKYLVSVDGILGIYISDKDGVLMASGKMCTYIFVASVEDVPDQAWLPYIVTTFMGSIQQASKMELGSLEWMVTRYQEMVICQFNFCPSDEMFPLFLTVVGSPDCDLGSIISLESFIRPLLNRLAPEASNRFQTEAMSRNAAAPYFRV